MTDFTLEPSPKPRTHTPLEADSLCEVIQALRSHNLVAEVENLNISAAKFGGLFIKSGWRGCSDLLGQLNDGRLLAVECKRPKGCKLSSDQSHFLEMVRNYGGVSFVATNLHDVLENLGSNNG